MDLSISNVFTRSLDAYLVGKRLIVNEGGTSSTKTYSAIQLLISIALLSPKPLLISIVAESFPHLRRGAIRDFMAIMGEGFNYDNWNKSDSEYNFGKSKIEFFSADDSSKLRGGRRDILFLNEANNITLDSFNELDVRTRKVTFIDFNPVAEFWAHEMQGRPEVAWIHSTYLDALEHLEKSVVDNILSRKDRDPNWWRIYGLGLVGKIEGLVHPYFQQCETLPENGRLIYGLDFGYSGDPCVLVKNRIPGTDLYSEEMFYELGMNNHDIAKRMTICGVRKNYDIIIADCAEPKSIDEIKAYGFDIRPCGKGPDSLRNGIQKINQYRQFWTKTSLNCIKEQRNYRYEKDKDGKFTDKPIDDFNHGMDGRRYAVATIPDPKVIPLYNPIEGVVNFKKFSLLWDESKISANMCLHYGAMTLSKDLILHIMGAIWDDVEGCLYVYLDGSTATAVPTQIVRYLAKEMHLNEFYFEKFFANKLMLHEDHRSMVRVYNDEFRKIVRKQGIKLQESYRYDPYGSAALLKELVKAGKLIVHTRCGEVNRSLSTWRIEKGKFTYEGQQENILMILSELKKKVPFAKTIERMKWKGYQPVHPEKKIK